MSCKPPFPQALSVELRKSLKEDLNLPHLVWDGREGNTGGLFLCIQKGDRF